jgi:hypothetical protein
MFERIVLRKAEEGNVVTLGQIAEGLLFYQHVHLVLDNESIRTLLQSLGPAGLIRLLSRDDVAATHTEELLGTHIHTQSPWPPVHNYVGALIAGNKDRPELRLNTRSKRLIFWLTRWGMTQSEAIKYYDQIAPLLKERRFSNDDFLPGGVIKAARRDLSDPTYLARVAKIILANRGMESPDDLRFEVALGSGGFGVRSNLDFQALATNNPQLSPAHFLTEVLTARADLSIAAHYGGDFKTSAITSEIIEVKFSEVLRRSGLAAQEMHDFRRIVLPELPTVQQTIDSGVRSFDEFVALLERGKRFGRFLRDVKPDEHVVAEYLRETTKQGWIEKLPTKTVRYVIGLALDSMEALIPYVGKIWGGADAFMVEKVLGGWKPNHFVDKDLRPFLSERPNSG